MCEVLITDLTLVPWVRVFCGNILYEVLITDLTLVPWVSVFCGNILYEVLITDLTSAKLFAQSRRVIRLCEEKWEPKL